MSILALVEFVPTTASRESATSIIEQVAALTTTKDAELIESEVTADYGRVYVVVETAELIEFGGAVLSHDFDGVAELTGPDEVRLVGADLEQIKAARPNAGYLVEWDIPENIDMDTYLARKKEKSPKYAEVPEVSFLRTYVREDMAKCLCLYDANNPDDVRRAREVVETPIDRLHELATQPVEVTG